MPQWFIRFPEVTEFNESSAPFRKNSIMNVVRRCTYIWVGFLDNLMDYLSFRWWVTIVHFVSSHRFHAQHIFFKKIKRGFYKLPKLEKFTLEASSNQKVTPVDLIQQTSLGLTSQKLLDQILLQVHFCCWNCLLSLWKAFDANFVQFIIS